MPLVTPVPAPGGNLLDRAQGRWDQLLTSKPELQPAIELQSRLLAIVLELRETIAHGRLPRLSLPPRYLAAKLSRGVPALAGEPIPLPVAALAPAFMRICGELASGGAGDAAQAIAGAVASGAIDPGAVLATSIAREQQGVRAIAAHAGVTADLLWLAAELTSSPFAHALQESLFARPASEQAVADALGAWSRGYCPACGSWPVAAEVANGHRVLRCAFCSAGWEMDSYECVYCGEQGGAFVTAAPDLERKDRRVEACRTCAGYLKTIDVEELSPFPLVAITDLETMDLDIAAMQHHYARPAIKSFQKR